MAAHCRRSFIRKYFWYVERYARGGIKAESSAQLQTFVEVKAFVLDCMRDGMHARFMGPDKAPQRELDELIALGAMRL